LFSPLYSDHGTNKSSDLEQVDRSPTLLTTKITRRLPQIIGEREDSRSASNLSHNGGNRGFLLFGAWASFPVTCSRRRPSSLEVDTSLSRADLIDQCQLTSSEGTRLVCSDLGVEKGMEIRTRLVHDGAENLVVLLPDVKGLGSRNGARVSAESGFRAADEGCEFGSSGVASKDGFVTNDDEFYKRPLGPFCDGVDLVLRTGTSGFADEDPYDEFEARDFGCSADILETRAVGAVNSNGFESSGGDERNIDGDGCGVFAGSGVLVWGVGYGPLVARAADFSSAGSG